MLKKFENPIPEPQTQEFNPLPAPHSNSLGSTPGSLKSNYRSSSLNNRFTNTLAETSESSKYSAHQNNYPEAPNGSYTRKIEHGPERNNQGVYFYSRFQNSDNPRNLSMVREPNKIGNCSNNNENLNGIRSHQSVSTGAATSMGNNNINQLLGNNNMSNNASANNPNNSCSNNGGRNNIENSKTVNSGVSPWKEPHIYVQTRENFLGNFKGFANVSGRKNMESVRGPQSIGTTQGKPVLAPNYPKPTCINETRESVDFFPPNNFLSESTHFPNQYSRPIVNNNVVVATKEDQRTNFNTTTGFFKETLGVGTIGKNRSGNSSQRANGPCFTSNNGPPIALIATEDENSLPKEVLFLLSEEENNLAGFRESIEKDKARLHSDIDILIKDAINLIQQKEILLKENLDEHYKFFIEKYKIFKELLIDYKNVRMEYVSQENKSDFQGGINNNSNVNTKSNLQLIKEIEALCLQGKINKIYQYTNEIQKESLRKINAITDDILKKLSGLTNFYSSENFSKISKSISLALGETLNVNLGDPSAIIRTVSERVREERNILNGTKDDISRLLDSMPVGNPYLLSNFNSSSQKGIQIQNLFETVKNSSARPGDVGHMKKKPKNRVKFNNSFSTSNNPQKRAFNDTSLIDFQEDVLKKALNSTLSHDIHKIYVDDIQSSDSSDLSNSRELVREKGSKNREILTFSSEEREDGFKNSSLMIRKFDPNNIPQRDRGGQKAVNIVDYSEVRGVNCMPNGTQELKRILKNQQGIQSQFNPISFTSPLQKPLITKKKPRHNLSIDLSDENDVIFDYTDTPKVHTYNQARNLSLKTAKNFNNFNFQKEAEWFQIHSSELPSKMTVLAPNKIACSFEKNPNILIYHIDTQKCHQMNGHTFPISTIAKFKRKGESLSVYLASGDTNGAIFIWDTDKLKIKKRLVRYNVAVSHLTVSKTENILLSGHVDGNLLIWDFKNAVWTLKLPAHSVGISGLLLFNENIVTSGRDAKILVWTKIDRGLLDQRLSSLRPSGEMLNDCPVSGLMKTREYLISIDEKNRIKLWEPSSLLPVFIINHESVGGYHTEMSLLEHREETDKLKNIIFLSPGPQDCISQTDLIRGCTERIRPLESSRSLGISKLGNQILWMKNYTSSGLLLSAKTDFGVFMIVLKGKF